MPTSAPIIELEKVCCGYGSQEVLHNATFALPARSLTGIVGPNGGGKTTLLKLLLGLVTPHYGRVRVLGDTPARVRSRIGYVPQHLLFDQRYPVSAGDVVLAGRIERHRLGPYRRRDRQIVGEMLERVGLADHANRCFAELSGGERQRVLVAQALAAEPELLLLDEPTANVDGRVAQELHALFARLAGQITVVMVSHNLSVVAAHASHILCVNRTTELHPASALVQGHFHTAAGDDLLFIRHDADCHVIDASQVLAAPHAAGPEHRP
ncbi:MAG: ATP-binding cassette domain-containing protein [Lentisphaerae bacterium]|jgi:zinc transport system ATP-binding protein|nr:ATP-binding cassette domain-containing protein [Lentisphaerota bacterium]